MSAEKTDGLVIAIDPVVLFIPRDELRELRAFRMPPDLESEALAQLRDRFERERDREPGGKMGPVVTGGTITAGGTFLGSTLEEHHITVTRLWC